MMQKIYCTATDSSIIRLLCSGGGGLLKMAWCWPLPDGSCDAIVCEPRLATARAELHKMSAQGIKLLPGPHSPAPLTTEILATFASLHLPSTVTTAESLYEEIAKQSLCDAFSPHT